MTTSLYLTNGSVTLTLNGAQRLRAEPQPQVGMNTVPGKAGDVGQGLSRRSTVYIASGVINTSTEWSTFVSNLATMMANQAGSAVTATFTHGSTALLNATVWLDEPAHIENRPGTGVVLGDWEIHMRIRE